MLDERASVIMDSPLELEVHGLDLPSHVRELISSQLQKIESRCGRVTSCRLVIRAPGAHHQKGEPFAVSMRIGLPGRRDVNVGRISNNLDPRHSDLVFAVRNVFQRAGRQLQRQAHRHAYPREGQHA